MRTLNEVQTELAEAESQTKLAKSKVAALERELAETMAHERGLKRGMIVDYPYGLCRTRRGAVIGFSLWLGTFEIHVANINANGERGAVTRVHSYEVDRVRESAAQTLPEWWSGGDA